MKLYCSHTSPFARKVRVLIREKGATARVSEETVSALEDPASLHEANPLGKVPALINRYLLTLGGCGLSDPRRETFHDPRPGPSILLNRPVTLTDRSAPLAAPE